MKQCRPTAAQRFWAKVEKTEGCWNWTSSQSNGYGRFFDGARVVGSHRFSYELHNGPIPAGMVVDHICHNKSCVNPSHLRAVTVKQNIEHRAGASVNSASGVRGVSWHKTQRCWQAFVRHNYRQIWVGNYDSLEEAEAAVVAKRLELFTHNDADRQDAA